MIKFLPFLLLFSCSYQFQQLDKSINVPYITSDPDGFFTKELIYEITSSGFIYKHTHADYRLIVSINNLSNENIGYRYDRNSDGTLRKNIMATESRQKITATASLMHDDKVIWGPKTFSTDEDYDYVEQDSIKDLSFIDNQNNRRTILAFSLGQLESIDAASDAALIPLYKKLSKKIVKTLLIDGY